MAGVFLSYATADQTFALKLTASIELLGHQVWIDTREIRIGESLWSRIAEGLEVSEYLVVVLSPHTAHSVWVEREIQVKLNEELRQQRTLIFPVQIADCDIPPFLRSRRYADFRLSYEAGFTQLASTFFSINQVSGLILSDGSHQSQQSALAISNSKGGCYTNVTMNPISTVSEINVELGLPYIGKISGVWKPDEKEQSAAWELYVELVTRIAVVDLEPEDGLLRESLASLYVIFTTTREILRRYGPSIARPKDNGDLSFGFLALQILNLSLRPVLSTWHPLLLDYEHRKDPAISAYEHEHNWDKNGELRQALAHTQQVLREYAHILAQVARIPEFTTIPEK